MRWRLVQILSFGPLLFAGACAFAQSPDTLLADRQVTEVIAEYETLGYEFFYSTGIVRSSLTFKTEPPDGEPIARLRMALQSIGLTLQKSGRGVWLITRAAAQPTQSLEGRVLDAETGDPLEGVRIEIDNQVLTTDDQGRFQLLLTRPAPVYVSHAGYQKRRVYGSPEVEALLEIPLSPEPDMDEIVVVSSRYSVEAAKSELHLVDLELLDSIPRLGEDPLRITSHLPGMATIGLSAKPHIRGGLQDELLVLFNNLELLEPFHLRDFQSVFSSFNPSVIQSIEVYTGGFPARYGDRMSGVMDISPANEHRSTRGELSVSFLNAGLLLHGDAQNGRGDWLVSGRRGNLDIVTKEINSTVGEPNYSDWFAQYRYEIDDVTELDVGLIAYNDDIKLSDFDSDGEIAESRYRNAYGWAQLHRFWSPQLDGTTLIYFGSIKHDREGFLFDEDLDNGQATVDDKRDFDIWSLGQIFDYQYSPRVYAQFGARYTYQSGSYDYAASIERGELADFLGTELTEQRTYALRPSGDSGGLFASLRIETWKNLIIETGLRWDFQDYGSKFTNQVSPRVSAKFDIGDYTELRFSAGRFFQPEGIHELQVGDGITRFQDVQHADHYIIGWHQRFGESSFSLRTELFAKNFREPKRRFENLFNPLVLLPELASDRVEVIPEQARARGFETTLKYQPSETFMAWLTYTQTKVEDRINRQWQPRAWDQGNTLSAGLSWERDAWTIGATLLWHDGWRTTHLPAFVVEGEEPDIERNGSRLRDYVSLDLQISREWNWESQSLTAFLEVTNAVSRRNVGGIEYDVEEDEDAGGFSLTSEPQELLPLVPSIGVRWQF